jgi:hypothetical protein
MAAASSLRVWKLEVLEPIGLVKRRFRKLPVVAHYRHSQARSAPGPFLVQVPVKSSHSTVFRAVRQPHAGRPK